jgi:hypothetical protein
MNCSLQSAICLEWLGLRWYLFALHVKGIVVEAYTFFLASFMYREVKPGQCPTGFCCSIRDIWSFQDPANSLNYSWDTSSSLKPYKQLLFDLSIC